MLDQFKAELKGQDHKASGDLESSMKYTVKQTAVGWEILFSGEGYAKFLETGSKPHWVPIDALIDWIEAKGLESGEREVKNFAFAIQKKIAQEGTPTKGSYKFSKNGRRKEFITHTVNANKVKINNELLSIFGSKITATLHNIVTNNSFQ